MTGRPLLLLAAAFACGIAFSHFFPADVRMTLAAAVFFSAAACFCLKDRRGFRAALLAAFFSLGGAHELLEQRIPEHDVSLKPAGVYSVRGRIVTLPELKATGRRRMYSFRIEASELSGAPASGKIQVFSFNPSFECEYGDEVRLTGEVKIPGGAANEGQFDYGAYLAREKVRRVMNVFGWRGAVLLGRDPGTFSKRIVACRLAIKRRLDELVPFPGNEMIAALLLGIRKKIPETIQEDFQKTGTTHVLAVSGLNVSIVAGLLYAILRPLGLPKAANAAAALCGILFYAALSGGGAPVMRAAVMSSIFLGGIMLGHESDAINSLAAAFFALLVAKPQNLFSVGFQLSFISVAAIILLMPYFEGLKQSARTIGARALLYYREIFWSTAAATAATVPLVVYYFKIASPIGVVANLAVVPLMNFATFTGFLAVPFLFLPDECVRYVLAIPLAAIRACLWINHLLARVPFGNFHLPPPPAWLLFIYYAVAAPVFFRYAGTFSKRWIAATVCVCMALGSVLVKTGFSGNDLLIHELALKKGTCAFVEWPHGAGNLLVNAGSGKPRDDWKWVIRPFLMSKGVSKADAVLLTSYDAASAGGIAAIIAAACPKEIFIPVPEGRDFPRFKQIGRLCRERNVTLSVIPAVGEKTVSGARMIWRRAGPRLELHIEYEGKQVRLFRDGPLGRGRRIRLDSRELAVESSVS